MKVKTFLEVKGEIYELKISDTVLDDSGNSVDGTCDPDKKVIEISSKLKGYKRDQTFLHELGHAILFETHLNEALDENLVESIVDAFGAFYAKKLKIDFR